MREISATAKSECSRPARRSFLKKSGVALSGALAAAVAGPVAAASGANTGNAFDDPAMRLGMLEDANAVREAYRAYESAIHQERYEDALKFFAANSEVSFGGRVFAGRGEGVRRLYMETFRDGHTGKKLDSPESLDAATESIEAAADRKSAKASFPYAMRVGTPMDASLQLVQMARVQGGGIEYRRESGRCEVSFVKEGGAWKIFRLEYSPV